MVRRDSSTTSRCDRVFDDPGCRAFLWRARCRFRSASVPSAPIGDFALGDEFRRLLVVRPPPRRRTASNPTRASRDTRRSRRRTTSSRAIEPIPRPAGYQRLVCSTARDFVLHLGLGHRRAEVIFGVDGRRDLVAELHRLRSARRRSLRIRASCILRRGSCRRRGRGFAASNCRAPLRWGVCIRLQCRRRRWR